MDVSNHKVLKLLLFITLLGTFGKALANSVAVNSEYFRHLMFRESPYSPYRGIYPISQQQSQHTAHYRFDYDDKGRVVAISHRIGKQLIADNQNWDTFIWFAPKVTMTYSATSEVHHYFNHRDEQIAAHGGVFNATYKLDDSGKRISLHFTNKGGEPSENAWGIHTYIWEITNNGHVIENRQAIDGSARSIRPEFQFYRVQMEFDKDGKLAFMRNIDQDGNPVENNTGAAIDRITYDHNGNFIRWQVYNKDGAAIEGNSPMVHLGEHLYDNFGNKVGLRGFNRHGEQVGFSWGVFEHKKTYDTFGNQYDHKTQNVDGDLLSHIRFIMDETGVRRSWVKSFDKTGALTASPMLGGAAAVQYQKSEEGRIIPVAFNADMSKRSRN